MTDKTQEERDAANLQAFLDNVTPALAEKLIPQLTDKVESQIKGVLAKNDDLISRLAKKEGVQLPAGKTIDGDHVISKEAARDPQQYRKAKALAEKEGVRLLIQGRHFQ